MIAYFLITAPWIVVFLEWLAANYPVFFILISIVVGGVWLFTQFKEFKGLLDGLKNDISDIKRDVFDVRQDVAGVKLDVAAVKLDVAAVKQDVAAVKQDVAEVRRDLADVREDLAGTNRGLKSLESKVSELVLSVDKIKSFLRSSSKNYRKYWDT